MSDKKPQLVVLVIDDSEIIIDRLVSAIRELKNVKEVLYGYSYKEGKELLEKYKKKSDQKINVAILDVNLPDGNGIDLLRHIREDGHPVQLIIIMTEEPKEKNKDMSGKLGADYFLNKYNDLEKLIEIIASFDLDSPQKK